MRSTPFTARSTTVQVLAGTALVLFCLVFLRFVTLTFAEDTQRQPLTETIETDIVFYLDQEQLREQNEGAVLQMKNFRCGTGLMMMQQRHRQEQTVQQELRLRATQNPEVDETLLNRLGLDAETAQVPIMR